MSSAKNTSMFLVTANIASCFDQPKEMLNPWLDEFFKVVEEQKPQFIAIHCQEVGGKNYETSMENVGNFMSNILGRAKLMDYTRANIFIDEEFSSAEKFTALGNLYFIRSDVQDIQIWDFIDKKYVDCTGIEEHLGSIENVSTKQKSKFPQEFFPECKWSRKGFLRTRWCINGTQLDLVNIHLFHDASNFMAMEKFPSVYTLNRKRAMEHTLDRFHNDEYENVPMFIFGDFNFRVDTKSVVEHLTEGCSSEDSDSSGEKTRFFRTEDRDLLLTVSKKNFDHQRHSSIFMQEKAKWLRPFDKELQQFSSRLFEYPISFPPSYPFEEGLDSQDGKLYMKTRCPSWCDRIILSSSAKQLVDKCNSEIKYNIIGLETRMGDHKPVGLSVQMPSGAGIVRCCSSAGGCTNFVHVPHSACFSVGAWCRCQAYPICPGTPNSPCYVPSPPPACNPPDPPPRRPQCVCSLDEPDMDHYDRVVEGLKNDCQLKRVHSDPVKVHTHIERLKGREKYSLVHSHSLDSKKRTVHRLRLRATSSRLISHHSSSSEEWFEEVPPSDREDGTKDETELRLQITSDPEDSISAILRTPKVVQAQNSLSNLLITDKSKCQVDLSDDSSLKTDGASIVAPCPCAAQDPYPEKSSDQCCCVVS